MEGTIIIQGVTADVFFAQIGEIVDAKVKEAVEAVRLKESPDDLLTYDDIMRVYNMSAKSYISTRVSEEKIMQHKKGGIVAITRADAEMLFRKRKTG